jgi:hypothetical protein
MINGLEGTLRPTARTWCEAVANKMRREAKRHSTTGMPTVSHQSVYLFACCFPILDTHFQRMAVPARTVAVAGLVYGNTIHYFCLIDTWSAQHSRSSISILCPVHVTTRKQWTWLRAPTSYRCLQIPGSCPELARSRSMIRDILRSEKTARGRPVMVQRMRMRDALVLGDISASCRCAAPRTALGRREDMTIDFSTRRGTSASRTMRRRSMSIAIFPILARSFAAAAWNKYSAAILLLLS